MFSSELGVLNTKPQLGYAPPMNDLSHNPQQDFEVALARQLDARQRAKNQGVEKLYSRRQVEQAFIETFELVGGVPRLAIWANEPANYAQFLKLLMTFAPKEQLEAVKGAVIEYRSNVPPSPLNRPAGFDGPIDDGDGVVFTGAVDDG